MADTIEKVYCTPTENKCDPMAMMAMMNNQNQWSNNPFFYLIWLAWMGNGGFGWGNNRTDVAQNADLARQMQTLQGTVTDNHNNDLALQAINGNRDALGQLAQTFNTDLGNIQAAIGSVQAAIENVAGTVGYTSESIKNAIALGDKDIIKQMCDCCCSQKTVMMEGFNATQREILNGSYQNQLANERQTNVITSQMAAQHSADQLQASQNNSALLSRIDQLANGVQSGFANLGYQNEKNTASIIQNNTAMTQKVLDSICQQTTQGLRDQLASAERQLQSQTIINQLKGQGCCCG